MGVHGLWDLLAPVGRRVSVETLAGRKLAIDASIWMVQFMKAMRDEKGEMVRNAHLLGFFRRICKLLFLRVRPVFVFDGATPALKRRTLAARRRHRDNARAKIRKTAEKLLINHLKTRRLEELEEEMKRVKEKGDAKGKHVAVVAGGGSAGDAAGFESSDKRESLDELLARSLAAEEEGALTGTGESSGAVNLEEELDDGDDDEELMLPELQGNIDPNVLASLPPSLQLDLLVQMRERLMAENRQKYQKIKKAPAKFSELQIQSYLKTVAFRREIDEVQKAAAGRGLGGVQTSRIASEANREFIFSTSFTGDKQMLTSLTPTKKNNNMQPDSTTKEPRFGAEVPNSSSNTLKLISQQNAELPSTSSDNGIESYRDERGRFRVSKVRALGVRMTRDLERNLELMKEQEQECFAKNASSATEPYSSGGNSVDISAADGPIQIACSGNNSVMEISFIDGDQGSQDDISDSFFSHLVGGTPPIKLFPDSISGHCSADSGSDPDDLWEEGINIGNSRLTDVNLNESQSYCSGEDAVRKDMFVHPQMVSQQPTKCNVTSSKGFLEEEADIQEAIRRSLEDARQRHIDESTSQTQVMNNDEETVLLQQNRISEGHRSENEIDDNMMQVDSFLEDMQEPSFIKGPLLPKGEINRNGDPHENGSASENTENVRQSKIISKSPDISVDAELSDTIPVNIVEQGRSYRNTLGDSYEESEIVHSDCQIVFASDKKAEGAFIEGGPQLTTPTSDSKMKELNQKTIAVSSHSMAEDSNLLVTPENIMEMTEDEKQFPEQKENSLGSQVDMQRFDLEEMPPSGSHMEEHWQQPSFNVEMSRLRQERENLGEEQRRHEINAESVSSEMFAECQELLQMFGLPYIIAPMEAEAQCAHMELVNLVDGVVTDDSDVFLFGARSVYKNIFDDRKYVETYFMKDIENELGLTREKLIRMALLLGSDYTEGVSGIGIVNAIEVAHAFPEEDGLRKFREWLESPDPDILDKIDSRTSGVSKKRLSQSNKKDLDKSKKDLKSDENNFDELAEDAEVTLSDSQRIFTRKHRNVSKNWHIPSSFPSQSVISAYSSPQVDESTEPFSWGKPDLVLLRKLCWERFGWNNQKADELLLPVLKEYNKHETQLRLEAFYTFNERFAKIRSQRIKKAVKGITGKVSPGLLGISLQDGTGCEKKASKESEPSSVGGHTECDGADSTQRSHSSDFHIEPVNIGGSDMDNHEQRDGSKGRKRGQGSGKRKSTGDRNAVGRGRGRGRGKGRGKPDNDTLGPSSSDDEKNFRESTDNAAPDNPEIRRSARQHKMARYAEESSDDDALSCLPDTSDLVVENKASAGEDLIIGSHGGPSRFENLDHPEDDMPKDYLFSGGGFCADEDGAGTTADPAERTSTSLSEAVVSGIENVSGFECLIDNQVGVNPAEEPAHLDTGVLSSTIDTSGLRSMPTLRRKRKNVL